jgi:formylglycine-generating enzyme required for sulfatase activity
MQATCEVAVMSETGLQADGGCGAAWPLPVGSKPAGASPYGVLDAVGNVGEWVEDCMEASYEGAPTDGSARTSCTWPVGDWLSGQYRGHRGSDWMKPQWFQRGAQRGADPPTGTLTVVGIRCCRS